MRNVPRLDQPRGEEARVDRHEPGQLPRRVPPAPGQAQGVAEAQAGGGDAGLASELSNRSGKVEISRSRARPIASAPVAQIR